jgi:hypothetical protein
MRFVEYDEIEKRRIEFLKAQAQGLLGGNEEALSGIDFPCVDPVARLVRQVGLETVGQRLIDKRIAVGEEKYVLRLVRAKEEIDERHGDARFTRTGCHHEQGATLIGGEGFCDAADRFVLVGSLHDRSVDGHRLQWQRIQSQKQQALQVLRREESGDDARIRLAHLPEPDLPAVRHEAEWRVSLFLRDLGDVMAELLVGFARVARAAFCFDDC